MARSPAPLALRSMSPTGSRPTTRCRRAKPARRLSCCAIDAIITMDYEGKVHGWNPAAERMFGYTELEILGRTVDELIIPQALRQQHVQGLAHFLATGQGPILDQRLELSAVRANGSEFSVELSITQIQNFGRPLFAGFVRDITQRKRVKEALQRSERNFVTLVEK